MCVLSIELVGFHFVDTFLFKFCLYTSYFFSLWTLFVVYNVYLLMFFSYGGHILCLLLSIKVLFTLLIERYSLYLCLYYVYLEVLWTCFSDKQSFLLCLYIYMDVFWLKTCPRNNFRLFSWTLFVRYFVYNVRLALFLLF